MLLSDALPILENMGLKVLSEEPHEIRTADGGTYSLHDFRLRPLTADGIDVDELREAFQDAVRRRVDRRGWRTTASTGWSCWPG